MTLSSARALNWRQILTECLDFLWFCESKFQLVELWMQRLRIYLITARNCLVLLSGDTTADGQNSAKISNVIQTYLWLDYKKMWIHSFNSGKLIGVHATDIQVTKINYIWYHMENSFYQMTILTCRRNMSCPSASHHKSAGDEEQLELWIIPVSENFYSLHQVGICYSKHMLILKHRTVDYLNYFAFLDIKFHPNLSPSAVFKQNVLLGCR